MSAAQEQNDVTASHYVDYDEYVDFQLEKARAHIRSAEVFTTLTLLVTAFIGYLLLFVVFDQWVIEGGFGPRTRLGMLSLLLTLGGYVFVRRVAVPLLRRVHPLYAARMIERAEPKFNSNLLNFVDLREAAAPGTAPIVLRAIEKRAAVQLSHLDVDEAIDRRPLLQTAYALLAVVVVSALYIVLSPKDPFSSVKRALLPTADIDVATETTIAEVTPGDESVPARSQVIVEADIRGKEASTAQILFTTADHRDVDQPVEMRRIDEGLPRFRGTLNGENGRGLLQSLTYVIVAGDARSREYQVDVIQPPSARVDEVDYAYPDYMQLEKKTASSGNIDAWEGTLTTVRATANMPIKSATLVLTDTDESGAKGEEIPMSVADGTQLAATWNVGFREDGTFPRFYRIEVKTAKGEIDPDPTRYSLKVRPDQRPEVTLLSPAGDLQKPANAIIPLVIQAADPDFKVRSVLLKAERNGEEILNQRLFEERLPDQAIRGTYELSLKTLKARPGETLQFWVEARDNKVPTANRGTTPKVNLQILAEKSAEEIQQELAKDKKAQQDQLAAADQDSHEERRDPAPEEPSKNPDEADNRSEKPEERAAPGTAPSEPQEATSTSDEDPATRRDPDEAGSDRPPAADDPQQALERLLRDLEQEQAKQEQSEPGEAESGEETGEKSSQPGDESKKGTDKQPKSNPDRTQPPNKPAAKEESEQNSSEDQDKEQSQPDRKKPGAAGGKKSSSGESGKKGSDQQGKKPDGGKPSDKSGTDQTGSAQDRDGSSKSAGKTKPKEPKPEGTSGAEKTEGTGDQPKKNQPDDPDTARKPSSSGKDDKGKSPPEPGKSNSPDPDKEGKVDESAESSDAESEKEKSDEGKSRSSSSDPASDGAGDKNPTGSDESATKGAPSTSPSDKGEEEQGEGEGGESTPKSGPSKSGPKKPPKPSEDPNAEGEEEPAERDPEAKKSKATGKETGEAEGADEPDAEAADASENVKRKPGSKPGAQQNSRKNSKAADKQPKAEGEQPKTGQRKGPSDVPPPGQPHEDDPQASEDEPESTQPGKAPKPDAPKKPRDPKRDGPQPKTPSLGDRGSGGSKQGEDGTKKSNSDDAAPQPGNPRDKGAEKGTSGKTGEGSESPEGTAPASESSSKEGEPGKEGQPGQGKPSAAGGESKAPPGAKKSSSSGEEGEGTGSEGESGEQGKGKGSPGKNSSSAGSRGKPSAQPGSQPGGTPTPQQVGGGVTGPLDGGEGEGGNSGDADGGPGKGRSEGEGDGPPTPQDDEARLDYAKKATNLVLSRLKKQLERGDVDEQLLKEMGWKDRRDVEKFVKYLEENLNASADDNSAEAVAKRLQFEETLKSLRTGSETERRVGGRSIERRTQQTGARNIPLPPEYREQFEAYSKSLSKPSTTGDAPRSKAGKK